MVYFPLHYISFSSFRDTYNKPWYSAAFHGWAYYYRAKCSELGWHFRMDRLCEFGNLAFARLSRWCPEHWISCLCVFLLSFSSSLSSSTLRPLCVNNSHHIRYSLPYLLAAFFSCFARLFLVKWNESLFFASVCGWSGSKSLNYNHAHLTSLLYVGCLVHYGEIGSSFINSDYNSKVSFALEHKQNTAKWYSLNHNIRGSGIKLWAVLYSSIVRVRAKRVRAASRFHIWHHIAEQMRDLYLFIAIIHSHLQRERVLKREGRKGNLISRVGEWKWSCGLFNQFISAFPNLSSVLSTALQQFKCLMQYSKRSNPKISCIFRICDFVTVASEKLVHSIWRDDWIEVPRPVMQ